MIWILCTIAALIAAVIIWFLIPYSPTKNQFRNDVQKHLYLSSSTHTGIFTEETITPLPELIQNHIKAAGLIGQPIPTNIRAFMPSVRLYQSRDSYPLIIDYTLYLFANPVRMAYIRTSLFGIPFEGYDSTQEGVGFMRGVIGKLFTLFNETGPHMDRGQLLTWLGEAPLLPSILLSEYITWEAMDASHVRATLNYKGISGSGVFTFNENGLIHSFHTYDRARTETDGSIEYLRWSAVIDGWRRDESGIYIPALIRATWHEDEGDLVYFSADGFEMGK